MTTARWRAMYKKRDEQGTTPTQGGHNSCRRLGEGGDGGGSFRDERHRPAKGVQDLSEQMRAQAGLHTQDHATTIALPHWERVANLVCRSESATLHELASIQGSQYCAKPRTCLPML